MRDLFLWGEESVRRWYIEWKMGERGWVRFPC